MAAEILKNIIESFFSKVGEKLADYGLERVIGKKDSKYMLETLRRSLNSLSDKACDINEQIRHGEQSGKKKRKREVENWLKEVRKIENELGILQNEVQEEGVLGRSFGEGRVSELNARVCELVEQSRHFGAVLLDAHEMRGEPLLTASLIGEALEENIEIIWKWLVIDKVKSIGIYGMGGVGKTTLAKRINNTLLNENQFSIYWVTVSQVFTTNKLQSDIAKVIGLDLSDEDNEGKRACRLNQALSLRKDFVIILDDVWSDIDLEKLGDPLGVEGCRLIVTTRSLTVCHKIDCQEIIEVETLQIDESWTLFRETLGKRTVITSEVEEIAKCMAKQCDGLPLGIVVLAKSMKGVTDIHKWRNVYDEICESPMELDDMKDNVFRVLEYSFNRLDPEFHETKRRKGYTKLQLCFLYCSLYPEDYAINKDELIRKFISEELVDIRKSREKQLDHGYTMLSKLVNLCLLEPIYGLDGESFEAVVMHDLVRDMALKLARESLTYKVFGGLGLKKIPNEEEWTEDVDKMSLMSNYIMKIQPGMTPNCPKLATLLLNENPLESIPEYFFAKMSGLRILDLSYTSIQELPNSLSDLESLKTLLLNHCEGLVSLPFLGKLKALRELDLSWTSIEKMPKDDTFMDINTLRMYKCSLRRGAGEDGVIILSKNIQALEIQKCNGLSSCILDDFKSCPSFFEKLRIVDCEGIESILNMNDLLMAETTINIGSVHLNGLPDLKGLVNWEVGGAPPPSPPPQAATIFSSITQLSIFSCKNMKTLGLPLPFLENVESIDIGFCGELEELIQLVEEAAADDEDISQLTFPLPNLKRLHLLGLPKLKSICKARIDCNSIEVIEILMCPRVKKLPLFLSPYVDNGQLINYSPPPHL